MAGTIPLPATLQTRATDRVTAKNLSIPWYIWCNVVAVACSVLGGVWDISWHESVGRDTFWTPAHLLIQLCGILAGFGCGYLILSTTFRKDSPLRANSVSVWGFRGPLGAFICTWGAVGMITSAPFDNWWHNAYGLDVKILSPPHILLALGMTGIRFGTLVLVLAEVNRANRRVSRPSRARSLFLLCLFARNDRRNHAGGYVSLFHARREVLPRHHARRADLVRGRLARLRKSLGRHHHDRRLHSDSPMLHANTATHPSGTKARPRLSKHHPPGPAGFSASSDRSRDCLRPRAPPRRRPQSLDASHDPRRSFTDKFRRRSMALRKFPNVARVAQLVFRHKQLPYFVPPNIALGPQRLVPHRTHRRCNSRCACS